MKHYLNLIIQKISLYYHLGRNIFLLEITYFLTKKRLVNSKNGVNTVFFDLIKINNQRLYSHLIISFHEQGYNIYLKHNLRVLSDMHEYGVSLMKLRNLRLFKRYGSSKINHNTYICDHDNPDLRFPNRVRLNDDITSLLPICPSSISDCIPFYMSPYLRFSGYHNSIPILRSSQKKIRIIFSGNAAIQNYDSPIYERYHKKLSRYKMLRIVESMLSQHEVVFTDDLEQYSEKQYENRLVISEWSRSSLKKREVAGRIADEKWLNLLSSADFLLACPGVFQPLCHNLIEAMSVGVIPILEHPEFMNPPLEDGINALVFNGETELINKIKEAINMPGSKIKYIQKCVISYYESNLSDKATSEIIYKAATKNTDLYAITTHYFANNLSNLIRKDNEHCLGNDIIGD